VLRNTDGLIIRLISLPLVAILRQNAIKIFAHFCEDKIRQKTGRTTTIQSQLTAIHCSRNM